MKKYLTHSFNNDDPSLISVIDELPLWSAPFGLKLLDKVKIKPNLNILDLGCGTGFPLIELAERFGNTSLVYGIDPWVAAVDRVNEKIKYYGISNVSVVTGAAEELPFEDDFFDLIVSNNGINNVQNLERTIYECARVSKKGAQFCVTVNLNESLREFYDLFKDVLNRKNKKEEIDKIEKHIYKKRRPVNEITKLFETAGFKVNEIIRDKFYIRYIDGSTFLNNYFIKFWFLPPWKEIIKEDEREEIFELLENELNKYSAEKGELKLTIPFVLIDAEKI